ncbi:MAG: hypothetical protein ACYC0V_17740 [Armatimonadota bacterium]
MQAKDISGMSVSRLRTIHVIIIGTVMSLIVVSLLYFLVVKKTYERLTVLDGKQKAAETIVARKGQALKDLDAARIEFSRVTAEYAKYEREKMPPVTFEDRGYGMIAQWKEQTEILGPMLEKWPAKSGIKYTSSIQIAAPQVNPNTIAQSIIRLPVGSFSVTGSFSKIMQHIRTWRKFGRLVQIDGLSLSGYSPNMTAQYTVTVIEFPRGGVGPNIDMAGGGAGGGGMGGMMGGMPGMPGMGGSGGMMPTGAMLPNAGPTTAK